MTGPNRALIISDALKVDIRLRALGLTPEIPTDALRAGISAAALCTANHPRNFGGTSLWAEASRWLREMLIPMGWHRDDTGGQPSVVRGDNGMAIVVVRGDAGTGDPKAIPSTQYARGPMTVIRIERNGDLPFDDAPPVPVDDVEFASADVPTWLLMHHRKGSELVCELSFPTDIDKSGFVKEWGERIILAAIPLDPNRMPVLEDQPVNPDVTVRRRA